MPYYPDLATLISKQDEKIVMTVYRSYLSILSEMALCAVSLIIVIILNYAFDSVSDRLRWLSVIPVLLFLNIFRTYYNDVIHFELHKLTQYHGRLALTYGMPSIKYTDIRAVSVEQDILGRIFDYGEVRMGTAGMEGWEVDIKGVRAPRELAALINELRTWNIERRSHEEAAHDLVATNNE
jgi:hypothetical protein